MPSADEWINKLIHPYTRILFGSEKECSIDTDKPCRDMLSEK